MCNAWNHPAGCTCGFGGVGHTGRRESGSSTPRTFNSAYWWVPPITHTYESYVNPNAWCPVCGASVFFYQSPDGGRVFFNELGPPWPKHPCTDNRSIPKNITHTTIPAKQRDSARIYSWQRDGWIPFFISAVSRIDKFMLRIEGICEEKQLIIFINKDLNPFGDPNPITNESIAYLTETREGKYDLSFINVASAEPMTINAFSSLLTAKRVKNATKAKETRAERVDRQRRACYNRYRRDVEQFLSLVANCEVRGYGTPRLPKNLMSRLQVIVASQGGVLEWAKSRPEYPNIKRLEKSKLQSAAKIRRRTTKDRKKIAATKRKTKSRQK